MRIALSPIVAASLLLVAAACDESSSARRPSLTAPDAASLARSGDRNAPSAPTQLRVTATTSYSVTLAWNPSTDKAGPFTYHVLSSGGGGEMVLPQTQTTATWTTAVFPRNTYVFLVYAVDAEGNRSANSNGTAATLPADTRPPTTPTLAAPAISATYVTLSASATDDGPIRHYLIFENGAQVGLQLSGQDISITSLTPGTTHTLTAQAVDYAFNKSPISAPITVTTKAVDPTDVVAPTSPTNLSVNAFDLEIDLTWTGSTDDRDPSSAIRYEVYLNGVLEDSMYTRTNSIVYGVSGANTIAVIAVDGAGNRSAPTMTTVQLP
jgi:hypothetical protein